VTAVEERARPGRHRSAAADAAILDATLAILRDRGYGSLTIAAVIERAGVSSATLYRRWTTKSELVAAAVASLAPEQICIDTGSLDGDLGAFVRHAVRQLAARGNIATLLQPGDKADPELAGALKEKLLVPRLRSLQTILDNAAARGELPRRLSADALLPLVIGPLHYRTVLDEPLSPAFARHVTRFALDGIRGSCA
jgi:AcrR family transcriptional regulator